MFKIIKSLIVIFLALLLLTVLPGCSKSNSGTAGDGGTGNGENTSGNVVDAPAHKIENLKTFTRLYGYVRFFYPGDEAFHLDWDRFAVYGAKSVENITDRGELKTTLQKLFHPVAPALTIYDENETKTFSKEAITPPDTSKLKVVSWQHQGVGMTNFYTGIYDSIRLNRKNRRFMANDFGAATASIDAAPYKGKQLKLTASVKVSEGKANLWMLQDSSLFLFAEKGEKLIPASDWATHELIENINTSTKKINFGCALFAKGSMWADDFKLFVRDNPKDNPQSEWKEIPLENSGFETDEAEKPAKGWQPSRGVYTIGVSNVEAAVGKQSLGIASKELTPFPEKGLFEERVKFGEYIDKQIGSGLKCMMPLALYGTKTQTWPASTRAELEELKAAMKKETKSLLAPDDRYNQLASLVITWNVMQHFYPYFDITKPIGTHPWLKRLNPFTTTKAGGISWTP